MHSLNAKQVSRLIVVIGISGSAIFLVLCAIRYAYPFLIAFILAFLLNPFIHFLEKQTKIPRPFAVVTALLAFIMLMFSIMFFLLLEIVNGTAYLAEHLPKEYKTLIKYGENLFVDSILPFYHHFLELLSRLEPAQQLLVTKKVEDLGDTLATSGADAIQNILQYISSFLLLLPNYLSVLLFILLGTFFISKDWHKLRSFIYRTFPTNLIQSAEQVTKGLQKAFWGFLKAQFTLISITTITVLIGLLILQINHAVTIALITGMVDLIPYLGTGLIFIPWILYLYLSGDYLLTIGMSVLYAIIVIQRQLIEPKVLASNIGINPLAALIALFIGLKLWGLGGMIAGPVLLVVMQTLYQSGVIKQLFNYIKG